MVRTPTPLDLARLFRPVDIAVLDEVRPDCRPGLVLPHAKVFGDFRSERLVEARAKLNLFDIRNWKEANFDRFAGSAMKTFTVYSIQ